MKLLMATGNLDKVKEFKSKIDTTQINIELLSLKDFEKEGFDVIEDGETLKDNAFKKAKEYFELTQTVCFADDTGLEVDSLNGAPGVYSARYAGENCSYEDNCKKLLKELGNNSNRKANFKTVICFYDGNDAKFFEGICEGEITSSFSGNKGFGYDPVFKPDSFNKTFAEMDLAEKNLISHRGKALSKFIDYLIEIK